jgi:glycosyltransferase involved in cell wall biosynthesis
MYWADHIHFRAPGNVVLIGFFAQVFFPRKKKTAKYAGNWTNYSGEPWSYKLQKKLASNTWLSRNMKVLVYGEWPNQTTNVLAFFTASYSVRELQPINVRDFSNDIRLVFVGTLLKSKNPMLSIQIAEYLFNQGVKVHIELFGDGVERDTLGKYIEEKKLAGAVTLRGNVPAGDVKTALQNAHFLVFLSNSEGWPKAVAESMFWGCVPVTKPVSCVPWMLGNGSRGILCQGSSVSRIGQQIIELINDSARYGEMSAAAAEWSHAYTLERFSDGIKSLLT